MKYSFVRGFKMADKKKLLIINPGSTSTKVSLFEDENVIFEKNLFHDSSVLLAFNHVNDQMDFRFEVIENMLKEEGVDPESIDAYVGRGGSACTQLGGVTSVDKKLFDDFFWNIRDPRSFGERPDDT